MDYITSKATCEERIENSGRVCSGCGGSLTAIETVDNADNPTYWPGCIRCGQFDSGVSPLIFQIAEHMVKHEHYVHYTHLGVGENQKPEEMAYWLSQQIRGASGVVLRVLINEKKFSLRPQTA